VRDNEGRTLRAAAAVSAGMRLDIEFVDGRVGAVADGEGKEKSKPQPAAVRAKPRSRGGGSRGGQGSLFGS
jgi:exodeoxyribonuclease VII large subunit